MMDVRGIGRGKLVLLCLASLLANLRMLVQQQEDSTFLPTIVFGNPEETKREEIPVQVVPPSALQLESPRSWIHVKSYAEGISKWRRSVPELLGLAKSLNATLVEPCMAHGGRLVSCHKFNQSQRVPLSQVFDVSKFMNRSDDDRTFFPPRMLPHDVFEQAQQEATQANRTKLYYACLHQAGKGTRGCGDTPAHFDARRIPAINQFHKDSKRSYKRSDDTAMRVLQVHVYRASAIESLRLAGKKVILEPPFESFHPKHEAIVTELLQKSQVQDDNFVLVHWRAEKEGIDYIQCAQAIVEAGKRMKKKYDNNTSMVLMSSLNVKKKFMWSGARKMVTKSGSTSAKEESLMLLQNSGFFKLDEFLNTEDAPQVDDPGYLAIWDLILARKARRFATCTKKCKNDVCAKCNHLGRFADTAVEFRGMQNKTSEECWPLPSGFDIK